MAFFLFVAHPDILCALCGMVFAFARWQFVPSDRQKSEWFFLASLVAAPGGMTCIAIVKWISPIRPLKWDYYLFNLDGLLGFQPTFEIGRILSRHEWLAVAAQVGYNLLAAAILLLFGIYLWCRSQQEMVIFARTMILNLFAAVPLYFLFPAIGPHFAFPDFPTFPSAVPVALVNMQGIINCMPSVHFSTALLIVWFSRKWRIGLICAAIYAVIIVIATLGLGLHWATDLVGGGIYAVAIYKIGSLDWSYVHTLRLNEKIYTVRRS